METECFYGARPPTPPLVCRDEPRSDSECSDIDDVDDSGDEYVLTQEDDAQLRHDLMLDFEDEERVVTGRSRRRTIIPLQNVVLPSTSGATDDTTEISLPNVHYGGVRDVDVDASHSDITVLEGGNSRGTTSTTPAGVPSVDQEANEDKEMEEEEENYTNLKNKMTWEICDPAVCNERSIPEWTGSIPARPNVLEPIEYFRQFFDENLLALICNESNLYALQKDPNKPLSLTVGTLEVFLGICIYMSVVKLSKHRSYWSSDADIGPVIDYMSCGMWEKIKTSIHFADNSKAPEKGSHDYDKLYKIRPLLNSLKSKYNMIPMDHNVCVDEQVIPYKGTRGPRYYIKSKPNPWGFKVWTLADYCGIVHNFEVCVGATPKADGFPDLKSSANIVCKLSSVIPNHKNHRLFMGNFFSPVPLYFEMFKRGILCMGTVRNNRLSGLNLISDKDLKSKGKSAHVEYEGRIETCPMAVRVVRWNDNNICTVMSTMGSAQPVTTISRWDKSVSTTEKTEVNCPALIKHYNANMGGVDKMDALIAFYRMFFRSKKWYHRLFFHFVDLSICNAWLIYRRDITGLNPDSKYLNLHDFKLVLSSCLRMQNKPLAVKGKGRPSNSAIDERLAVKKHKGHNTKSIPAKPIRADQVGHFPINLLKRGRCKNPPCKSSPVTWCLKCQVYLCSTNEKRCFLEFHGVKYDIGELPH